MHSEELVLEQRRLNQEFAGSARPTTSAQLEARLTLIENIRGMDARVEESKVSRLYVALSHICLILDFLVFVFRSKFSI